MSASEKTDREKFARVYEMIHWGWAAQIIRTLSTFSIAEHLKDGPLSAEQIAEKESLDPTATFRMLRAAASIGFTKYDPEKQVFSAGELLDVLHDDSPVSLKYHAQSTPGPAFWLPAMRLPEAVATGRRQTLEAYGTDPFDYLAQHGDLAQEFSFSMSELSGPVITEAVTVMNVESGSHVIDVGGAAGAFVIEVAARNADVTGEVIDLAHVVPAVTEEARKRGVEGRVKGVSGDFFDSVPAGDIYLLKFIMHDWDDESCIKILSNVQRSLNPDARVFIVEMVMDDSKIDPGATLMDMSMLTGFAGQERTLTQYEALLHAAGFRATKVTALRSPYRVIEAQSITN